MALTTLAALKTHLGIASSNTSQDAQLTQFLAGAEAGVLNYLNRRSLNQATYTDYYCGNGLSKLILRNRPVQSITSVHEDAVGYFGYGTDPFNASTLLVAGTDYVLLIDGDSPEIGKSGILIRLDCPWQPATQQLQGLLTRGITDGIGNIKIVYVAGYTTIPSDVALAVHMLVAEIRLIANSGGILESEKLDYYEYTRGRTDMTLFGMASARKLLAPYVEVTI